MKREREREGRKKEERDGRRLPGSTSWPRRRGYIRMSELRDLKEGEHVVANLSELGQSIRVEATNLSNYIQSMVRQFDNAPIDYDSWHDVPSGFKEKMIAELEASDASSAPRQALLKMEMVIHITIKVIFCSCSLKLACCIGSSTTWS
uniref:Uncharacterized protein LOC105033335 isoform X3 n=1 Tax=Elaeis guineensis var. tenera TaxID=51953 RepID=A0A6I9QBP5_ELAGV|nr:uncharacterized protein LOC105033335 isoform X3 [Elaeis guineensis]